MAAASTDEKTPSNMDPMLKFDADGNVVTSFGGGMLIFPHGIHVDSDGNVWITDAGPLQPAQAVEGLGHRVIKFSPTGEVLIRLGTPGVAGSGPNSFDSPSDVVVAPDGTVFIADGHNNVGNNRVKKYSSSGEFIMSWGQTGYAPGEFRALHAIDMDASGRIFVGDRSNNRIQIFDQQGNHLITWTQFGRPSGISFDGNGAPQ